MDDSARLWGATRARVGPRTTVILGTSRAQAAIDPEIWAEVRPGIPVLNLAIEGRSAVRPLESLAADSGYRGLVMVDLPPFFVFDTTDWKNDVQAALAEYDHVRTSPALRWEATARRLSPAGVPFRHPTLGADSILADLLSHHPPIIPQFTTRPDRFRPFGWDYHDHPPSPEELTFFRTFAAPATPAQRDSIIGLLATAVRRIQRHGGVVVFVRFPSCGEVHRLEEEFYPRAQFWDIARDSIPAPFLDDRDDPALNGERWHCTDGSHLFAGQAAEFTRTVIPLVMRAAGPGPSAPETP